VGRDRTGKMTVGRCVRDGSLDGSGSGSSAASYRSNESVARSVSDSDQRMQGKPGKGEKLTTTPPSSSPPASHTSSSSAVPSTSTRMRLLVPPAPRNDEPIVVDRGRPSARSVLP
jgi:hypothetical protein